MISERPAIVDEALRLLPSLILEAEGGASLTGGKDALKLVGTHSVEEVAAMVWQCTGEDAFPSQAPVYRDIVWKRPRRSASSPSAAHWGDCACARAARTGNLIRPRASYIGPPPEGIDEQRR
jgi:hypothetical protein